MFPSSELELLILIQEERKSSREVHSGVGLA
jgi:hypothetical protein